MTRQLGALHQRGKHVEEGLVVRIACWGFCQCHVGFNLRLAELAVQLLGNFLFDQLGNLRAGLVLSAVGPIAFVPLVVVLLRAAAARVTTVRVVALDSLLLRLGMMAIEGHKPVVSVRGSILRRTIPVTALGGWECLVGSKKSATIFRALKSRQRAHFGEFGSPGVRPGRPLAFPPVAVPHSSNVLTETGQSTAWIGTVHSGTANQSCSDE